METTVRYRDDEADPLGEQPARRAAYSDLVAAVLDLRSPIATATFDHALYDAVAAGTLTDELARQLRWLQRESVRDVVTHATNVLPAALVALDAPITSDTPVASADTSVADTSAADTIDDDASTADQEPAPVDLTARRLLVAGLRPLPDSPFP